MISNALNGNGRVYNGTDNVPCTVNDTQEICEFIEEVVGKCADNPGYVFAPKVMECLASLVRPIGI